MVKRLETSLFNIWLVKLRTKHNQGREAFAFVNKKEK